MLSETLKKKWQDPAFRKMMSDNKKGFVPWNKGKKMNQGFCNKCRDRQIGIKHTPQQTEKIRLANLGKKRTEDMKVAQSERMKGCNSPSWRGGVTKQQKAARQTRDYRIWRKKVFAKCGEFCNWCKKTREDGAVLEVDHIKPISKFPELKTDVNNGRVLCRTCHMLTDTWGRKVHLLYC